MSMFDKCKNKKHRPKNTTSQLSNTFFIEINLIRSPAFPHLCARGQKLVASQWHTYCAIKFSYFSSFIETFYFRLISPASLGVPVLQFVSVRSAHWCENHFSQKCACKWCKAIQTGILKTIGPEIVKIISGLYAIFPPRRTVERIRERIIRRRHMENRS